MWYRDAKLQKTPLVLGLISPKTDRIQLANMLTELPSKVLKWDAADSSFAEPEMPEKNRKASISRAKRQKTTSTNSKQPLSGGVTNPVNENG